MFNKKINSGIIALLIGASTAFAFNMPAKKPASNLAVEWFQYNGGDINSPSSYSQLPGAPSCNGLGSRCAIQAPEDGDTGMPTEEGAASPTAVKKYL